MEWLIGPLIGALLTLFVYPFLQDAIHDRLVGILGSTKPRRGKLAGTWHERFYEHGQQPRPDCEDDNATIKQFGKRLTVAYEARGHCYHLRGNVDGNYFTGVWSGKYYDLSYRGAFQFLIHPEGDTMTGKWVGFSKKGYVKSGVWEWKRPHVENYVSVDV